MRSIRSAPAVPVRRRALALAVALAAVSMVGAPPEAATATTWRTVLNETFAGIPAGLTWADGHTYGAWRADFNGYGRTQVRVLDRRVLSERPKASTRRSETHASLVTTRIVPRDVQVTLSLRTVRQLRTGSAPNPWEVGWVLWHYTDNHHFYYVALKPTGWEIGKEDPAYPGYQRFLATGSKRFAVGVWHTVTIRQVGNVIQVWADGVGLTTFRDLQRPYLYGRVGLYNEDSEVNFSNVVVRTPA
jgi:hypothetical protein